MTILAEIKFDFPHFVGEELLTVSCVGLVICRPESSSTFKPLDWLGGLLAKRDVILAGVFLSVKLSLENYHVSFLKCFSTQKGFIRPALLTRSFLMLHEFGLNLEEAAFDF